MATRALIEEHPSTARLRHVRVLLLIAMAVVAAKLVMLQAVEHEQRLRELEFYVRHKVELAARRGTIYDRNGQELAVDRPAIAVYVHPDLLDDPRATADELAEALGLDPDKLGARLCAASEAGTTFAYVARQLSPELKPAVAEVVSRRGRAVGILNETKRVYPKGTLAADVIGFVGIDHQGLAGLEARLDSRLRGEPGLAVGERDVNGWIIPHRTAELRPARDGDSVLLTVDARVQAACEREIEEGVKEHQAVAGCAVVMHVPTGQIIAACDYPSYNPNEFAVSEESVWQPRFSTWTYEPGSTMKTFIVAAALASGAITVDQAFHCSGSYDIGSYTIRCRYAPPGGHGRCTPARALKVSCNVSLLQIGLKLGPQRLAELFAKLGFTQAPSRELPGQYQVLPKYLVPTWCATASFGQGVSITPLHLASAYAALANDGVRMEPQIVAAYMDAEGRRVIRNPVRDTEVFPPDVAREVRDMLVKVVDEEGGTGRQASVPGLSIAGKTGTSDIPCPGGYLDGPCIASFAGMFPADRPEYVVLVVIDRPKTTRGAGGTVAAPIFRDIAESLATIVQMPRGLALDPAAEGAGDL